MTAAPETGRWAVHSEPQGTRPEGGEKLAVLSVTRGPGDLVPVTYRRDGTSADATVTPRCRAGRHVTADEHPGRHPVEGERQ